MNSELTYDIVKEAYDELVELTNVLGLDVESVEEDLDSEVEKLIEERQAARKNKDFAKADEIRDKLKDMGIELLDTREGVKWKRI
jgi:cysteinyl-tRNA synthetase